jgi:hypothetical protein
VEAFKKQNLFSLRMVFYYRQFEWLFKRGNWEAGPISLKNTERSRIKTRIFQPPENESERNSLFIATKKPMAFHHVRTPLTHHGKEVGLDSLFLDPSTLNLSDAIILTDDKPILELLNVAASNKWRNDYNSTYNILYCKSGIPLFKKLSKSQTCSYFINIFFRIVCSAFVIPIR